MSKKQNSNVATQKKYKSLRSILFIWFTLFSVIPLLFVGWYSIAQFEVAFDQEVVQRLLSNGREVDAVISDYWRTLEEQKKTQLSDDQIKLFVATSEKNALNQKTAEWFTKIPLSTIAFYDKTGRLITTTYRDEKNNIRHFELSAEKVLLNDKYLSSLKDKSELGFVDINTNKVSLILFSKLTSDVDKVVGYVEQTIDLKDSFLNKIKGRLKSDLFFINDSAKVILSTRDDLKNTTIKSLDQKTDKIFTIQSKEQNFGYIVFPLTWDRTKLLIGIGTAKKDYQGILNNFNVAFLTVLFVVTAFLIATILITTNWFLKPVERLVNGLKSFDRNDQLIQLPVSNNTEIGLLTEAFNEMSYKTYQARIDLRKKLNELEKTNSELVEAQTKLVHSAKMTSLGQLVAGVAHELNNPIGFIYSNMTHLKEYTDQLFSLIDSIGPDSEQLNKQKNEIDYDFIKTDLPKLIRSCQDGAQRTRDIVLGLRNFSRLEEAQLKEIDLHESINTTLEILQAEIKNRIQIHKQFEPIPRVLCYASQINQVIMNILSNAIQAIQGQGQIWITTIPLKPGKDKSGRVQISIQDSGSGMDSKTLEKIFEPFFTTKGVGQGTGLGLSISYGIIQNHGGEIQVRSQKGVGTEFVIIIPISPPKNKTS